MDEQPENAYENTVWQVFKAKSGSRLCIGIESDLLEKDNQRQGKSRTKTMD
jgi:hypothetical protein